MFCKNKVVPKYVSEILNLMMFRFYLMTAGETKNASDCFMFYKGSRLPFILPIICVTPQQAFCGKLKFYAEPTSANKKVERERKFGIHKHTQEIILK